MKKLLLFIALFGCYLLPVTAQNTIPLLPTEVGGKVIYESIVNIPGKNADFIYFNASKWILAIPNNIKARVLLQDQGQSQIVAIGTFIYSQIISAGVDVNYKFKIQIDCKDAKYRIRLYEISYSQSDGDVMTMEDVNDGLIHSDAKPRHQVAAQINNIFNGIMASLKDAITKAANDDF